MLRPVCKHGAAVLAKARSRQAQAVAGLRDDLAAALAKLAEGVAAQLVDALGLEKASGGDAAAIEDAVVRARQALDALTFGDDWQALISVFQEALSGASGNAAAQALEILGISADDIRTLAGDQTAAWAAQRAAELVGMRRTAEGELVPNPNARWRIDEATRDMLRSTVEDALQEGASADELARAIRDAHAFSDARAEAIARTEMARADMAGAMTGYRTSGVVAGKQWLTAEDDQVSDECRACEEAGVIALDDVFPSGEDAPPNHPNCRCTVVPVLDDEMPADKAAKGQTMQIIWSGAARQAFRLHFPITKAEKDDEGRLIVEGIATSEALDSDGEVIDYESAKAAFSAWAGNIREQHDAKKAVGKALEVTADDESRTITVKAFISAGAADTQAKILDGTLAGFSIGGRVASRAPTTAKAADGSEVAAQRVFIKRLTELSVVDVGANPDSALSVCKADDADDEGSVAKGLYSVSRISDLLESIAWLTRDAALEAEMEGDNSPIPAQLREWVGQGAAIMQAMAAEEVQELLASLAPAKEAAQAAGDLAKAGKRFSAATKTALKAAHEACRAADKALADLKYDDDENEGAEADDEPGAGDAQAGKAAQTDDLAKAAAERESAVQELAKGLGFELAEPTQDALTKAAITELIELRKQRDAWAAQPAPSKGAARVVAKAADRDPETPNNEPAPVVKADGAVDDVATLVKAAQARPVRYV